MRCGILVVLGAPEVCALRELSPTKKLQEPICPNHHLVKAAESLTVLFHPSLMTERLSFMQVTRDYSMEIMRSESS